MTDLTVFDSILKALGGAALIISGLAAWLGKRYLDRRLEEERHRNQIELQALRTSSDRKIHVYKAEFELEFRAYQEIWPACATLMDEVARFPGFYERVETPEGKGTKRQFADRALAAFDTLMTAARRYEPFIPLESYEAFTDLGAACRYEIDLFYDALASEHKPNTSFNPKLALKESQTQTKKLLAQYRAIGNSVRERMATLSVKDA